MKISSVSFVSSSMLEERLLERISKLVFDGILKKEKCFLIFEKSVLGSLFLLFNVVIG